MSQSLSARTPWTRRFALIGVVLVPLAFAGLFAGAVSAPADGATGIPAAIVNNDQFVTTVDEEGTEQFVLAGRQLVTELTRPGTSEIAWTITNSEDARRALAAGEVYAVVTIPSDFSRSIVSVSSDHPQRASLAIETDDSHNYLTGAVADAVGASLVTTFGREVTTRVIAGLYSGIGDLGGALAQAADGAGALSDGAGELSSGLSALSDGAASAQSGANQLAGGVGQYVGGVNQLADGLRGLESQIGGLDAARVGVTPYTAGVSQLAAALDGAVNSLAADPGNPALMTQVQELTAQLGQTAASGPAVVGGVNSAFGQLAAGAGMSAAGAEQLAAQGGQLTTGASGLASGLSALQAGTANAADGAGALAEGVGALASGLQEGAAEVPAMRPERVDAVAAVAADPVGLTVTRNNEVTDVRHIISTLFVPLGLWIGALAVFLVLRPITARTLASTAAGGRLVLSAFLRGSALTVAQALLLVALLHGLLGVPLATLPASIVFAVIMALAFTAFHLLLTVGFGRPGLVISLLLLAVQLASTGGLYPIELVARPFQAISPFLPLTHAVAGMQSIMAASNAGTAAFAALVLIGFGAASLLVATLVTQRQRSRTAGLVAFWRAPSPL